MRNAAERRVSSTLLLGSLVILIAVAVCGMSAGMALAAGRFEAPPVLDLGAFVAPWAWKGARYRLEEKVSTDRCQARFTIKSDFGTFEALGVDLLAVRLGEIEALDKLESVSKTEAFAKAAAESRRTLRGGGLDDADDPGVSGVPAGGGATVRSREARWGADRRCGDGSRQAVPAPLPWGRMTGMAARSGQSRDSTQVHLGGSETSCGQRTVGPRGSRGERSVQVNGREND